MERSKKAQAPGGNSVNSVASINVGLPRDVAWHGKLVHTAIWKKSVPGRVMVKPGWYGD